MPIDITDIEHVDGDDNTAGIGMYIMFAKLSDIATLPKPDVDDSTGTGSLESLVTISGNIIMKTGKVFKKIYVTLETGKLDHESQGEIDGMSFLNKVEFLVPGSKALALGLAQWAKNSSLILLIQEQDGTARMLGHSLYPAKMISAPGTTGQKTADRKATTFTFQSARKGPAPIFKGDVILSSPGSTVDLNNDGKQDLFAA